MIEQRIHQNLEAVRTQIQAACERSARSVSDVQLVAVTKYAEPKWVELLATHHDVFGENRPQQLLERSAWLPDIRWHLIGQLQRNKVRLVLPAVSLIHSVDSLRLLQRIRETAIEIVRRPRILLQVNVTGESTKSGFTPDQLHQEWSQVLACADHVQIDGLMTMAAESDDPDDARPAFQALASLRQTLAELPSSRAAQIRLPELSMGMSGDFVTAIECGATLVRIGSLLFEGLSDDAG